MKIINNHKDIEMRPVRLEEEDVMSVLVGKGGFAVVELMQDQQGMYLRFVPTNPETMQPWTIQCKVNEDVRMQGIDDDLVAAH